MKEPIFYITDDENPQDGAAWTRLYPGGETFKVIEEKDGENEFLVPTFSGTIKMHRDNYEYVMQRGFDVKFTVIALSPDSPVSVSFAEWVGEFYRVDCKVNPDDRRIEVTPETVHDYKEIMEGMSKEFNLIQLEPPLTKLQLTRRAILQVYVRGADFLTNYVDSAFWEVPATNPSSVPSVLAGDYRFGYSGRKYYVTGAGENLSPDVSGVYIYDSGSGTSLREDGVYRLGIVSIPDVRARITRESDGFVEYLGAIDDPIPNIPVEAEQGVLLTSQTDVNSKCRAFYVDFYTRILTNKETIGGNATFPIPTTDIVESTGVFTRIHQKTYTKFVTSEGHSLDGSRWGVFPSGAQHHPGEHYIRPIGGVHYPVLQSRWVDASFWVTFDTSLKADLSEASSVYEVRHCYKLSDVVIKLLEAIGASVQHAESPEYSEFLYSVGNAVRGLKKTPIIVPITNILVGDYEEPQQVAKITLEDVLNLYQKALRVQWHVENGKLRFEHISWYENGGSYTGEVIGADLTGTNDPMTGKALGTDQSTYEYEKSEMPERFEYGWQGKSSTPFDGYPTDVLSPSVQKGNVQKWEIGKFISDIDLIHVGGSEVSKDGFLFVEAIESGGVFTAPFVTVTIDADEEYILQNGYAAFCFLVPAYHLYGMPSQSLRVNRYPASALSVARRRVQEVKMSTLQTVGGLTLVKTLLGNGKAFRVERELFSNKKTISIKHNL